MSSAGAYKDLVTLLQSVHSYHEAYQKDAEQKEDLRIKLLSELKYRETCEEVFDHIVTAVEHNTTSPGNFGNAANAVMDQDFGGFYKISKVEERAFDAVRKASWDKYKRYLVTQIAGSEVLITISVGVGIYLLINRQPQFMPVFAMVTWSLFFLPVIINWCRHFRLGYIFKDTRKSIRDEIFSEISRTPMAYLFWSNVASKLLAGSISVSYRSAWGISLMFTMGWVLLFAFFKLYRDEVKITLLAKSSI